MLSALEPRWRCRGRVVAASAMSIPFRKPPIQDGDTAISWADKKNEGDIVSVLEQVVRVRVRVRVRVSVWWWWWSCVCVCNTYKMCV